MRVMGLANIEDNRVKLVMVGGKGARESGHRIEPESMKCFDPKIQVTIGLWPDTFACVTEMRLISAGVGGDA